MARTVTFYEFTPTTKAKWERIARKTAALAHYDANADGGTTWARDEVIGHIARVMADDGNEMDLSREKMYLERMRMASVFSGPDVPTLDLVYTENGMEYRWIRDGQIPAGFLKHVLSIASAVPRLAFDYFVLMSHDYSFEELAEAVGPARSLLLLLFAEYYVRVSRAEDFSSKEIEVYIDAIAGFKNEVQGKITKAESDGFNSMAGGLLLTSPSPQ